MTAENWYILYVKSRHEKKIKDNLQKKNITVYLPVKKTLRLWKDRKKMVEMPVISGYVFVKLHPQNLNNVYGTSGILGYVKEDNKPAIVTDNQINSLKKIVEGNYDYNVIYDYKKNSKVEIIKGKFKGMQGYIDTIKGKQRFIVGIELINFNLSIDVTGDYLKKLD